jgi:hypothetical protein
MRTPWLLAILAACSNSPFGGGGGDDDVGDVDAFLGADAAPTGNGRVFDPAITKVIVEIDFETGQAPFTGPILGFGDTFDLSVTNIDRLFAGKKLLTIPRTTQEMQDIGAVPDEELDVSDLLLLAQQHRDRTDTADTKTYYVLFVSGFFTDETGPRRSVLGVSIGTTGVIAMFKDVIRSTNIVGLPNVVRFVEQSTLIHELAHAIGLVDNGVPLASAHKDEAHGAHCDDDRCVMYYLNEGAADAARFVQQRVLTGNTILFDADCLADVDALTGGP